MPVCINFYYMWTCIVNLNFSAILYIPLVVTSTASICREAIYTSAESLKMLIFHAITQAVVAVSLAQLLVASDPSEYLILANGVYIHQLSLDSARLRTIVTSQLENVTAIDYHYRLVTCNSY